MNLQPIRLIEDEPKDQSDGLGLAPYADIVSRTAIGTRGPFTIGVFADWGHGKSTVLKLARNMVKDSEYKNVVTVWFNAWQYEKEDHPIVPLVSSIVQQIDRHLEENKSFFENATDTLKKGYQEVVRSLRAIAYGFSAKAKVSIPGFAELEAGFVAKEMIARDEALRSREDPLLERTLYYNAFEALEQAVKSVGGGTSDDYDPKSTPKIVVFIDDLDRCLPDQALKLLESIKLVLSQPGFVFALAVDRRILEGFLAKRYREDFGMGENYAGAPKYLDKIVQLPLDLPLHTSRFDDYITELTDRIELQDPVVQQTLLSLGGSLAPGSGYNPRNLVRLLNNIVTDCHLWRSRLKGRYSDQKLEDEVALRLPVCAVSRILALHLDIGQRLQQRLSESQDSCDVLLTGEWRKKPLTLEVKYEGISLVINELKTLFEQKPFLVKVFEHDAGKRWLQNEDRRTEVEQFVVSTLEVEQPSQFGEPSVTATDKFDLDTEVRRILDLPPGAKLQDVDYQIVSSFDISFREISDVGLKSLEKLTELTNLNLWDTHVTDAGMKYLGKLIQLKDLRLTSSLVTDVGMKNLEKLTELTDLYITFPKVTDAGMKCLEKLTYLIDLYLWGMHVTDAGVTSLEKLTRLANLNLGHTKVTDEGLKSLEKLTQLTELNLWDTNVTDAGMKSLEKLTRMTTLNLSSTQVTDAGIKCLEKLTKLTELHLDKTQVTDAGIKCLEKLRYLSRLYIKGTQVTDAGLKNLEKSIPNCDIYL